MYLKPTLLGLALMVAAPLAATADMGALAPLLPKPGTDGSWTSATSDSAFAIANAEDAGAIRYYYLNTGAGQDKVASVTVDLADGAPNGFAGIIFSFDEASRNYHVFVAQNDGAFAVYRRNESGFNQMMSTSLGDLAPGPLTLSIEEAGDDVTFLVNDRALGSIGSTGMGEGGIGIAVGGIVSATFSDFNLGDASN